MSYRKTVTIIDEIDLAGGSGTPAEAVAWEVPPARNIVFEIRLVKKGDGVSLLPLLLESFEGGINYSTMYLGGSETADAVQIHVPDRPLGTTIQFLRIQVGTWDVRVRVSFDPLR